MTFLSWQIFNIQAFQLSLGEEPANYFFIKHFHVKAELTSSPEEKNTWQETQRARHCGCICGYTSTDRDRCLRLASLANYICWLHSVTSGSFAASATKVIKISPYTMIFNSTSKVVIIAWHNTSQFVLSSGDLKQLRDIYVLHQPRRKFNKQEFRVWYIVQNRLSGTSITGDTIQLSWVCMHISNILGPHIFI